MWMILATVPAVLIAAFSDTISLGVVLVTVIMVMGFAWASRKDKRSERWESLYELASAERKELQAKLDECTTLIADQKEIISKLDALQMPIKIVEMMHESVTRIDEAANQRLGSAMEKVMMAFDKHEDRANERHQSSMELMGELVKATTQLTIRVENVTP
jgi:hypothetical protein